ncbi:hypothetical protein L3X39_06465 [Sabulilitoribacter multivorans]|uniref:YD repeat-containing protein n=1 Tax=Flaviramulus multivorans TaxID=1304750 RepID=A0ABS9IHP0_9FLAO|nr:hypothetical protein [Flaviramulus multivorans]MCF7560278.1 hypothetical protein [Flaviramulus multivorans]
MRNSIFILILCITYFSTSCSSDSNQDDDSVNYTYKVTREYINDKYYIEYSYNENNLLTRLLYYDYDNVTYYQTDFLYDLNNNVIETKSYAPNSNNIYTNTYTYDDDNRLKKAYYSENFINPNQIVTLTFTYNDNIITVSESTDNIVSPQKEVTFELNNVGLVIRLNKYYYYSILNYDSNNNLTEINTYNSFDNTLINSQIYLFDNNPNPFYGQLKSIYFVKLLDKFSSLSLGPYLRGEYQGYAFPFQNNNVTTTFQNGSLFDNYSYSYNEDDYPIKSTETKNGDRDSVFYIEYE